MSDFKEWSQLVLEEIKRQDQGQRDIMQEIGKIRDEQIDQGKTLVRNTESLEHHIRRTDLLEKKVEHVEDEVDGLRMHVDKVNFVLDLLKPTKEKIKWLIVTSALITGGYGGAQLAADPEVSGPIEFIQRILK